MNDLDKIEKLITFSLIIFLNTVLCHTVFNIIAYIFAIAYMPWLVAFSISLLGMIVAQLLNS